MAYDIARIKLEFQDICRKAGCPTNVPIRLNGRLSRTLGRVHQQYNNETQEYYSSLVEFSKQLIETATDKSIRDVICHEACHYIITARTGESRGHDSLFKAVCAEIGTDNSGAATRVERTVEEKNIYKYSVFCPTCHKTIAGYSRKCRTINNISDCYCKSCGKGGLQVIQNW